ncbi:hypothetical protein L596_020972 [Steinernema carpocapsae]|uniref:Secreted protein n=1 Tax=Steinernema carpocapsae TaxID=34508 RepID=A0A4U5MV42_STECR|nr:hypothetical protein L596_020972 [Steinernema carpocapsae]
MKRLVLFFSGFFTFLLFAEISAKKYSVGFGFVRLRKYRQRRISILDPTKTLHPIRRHHAKSQFFAPRAWWSVYDALNDSIKNSRK